MHIYNFTLFFMLVVVSCVLYQYNKYSCKPTPYWPRYLFISILAAIIVRQYFYSSYVIPSPSMVPALSVNQRVFVNKMAYQIKSPLLNNTWLELAKPERFDVVAFQLPNNHTVHYVKRVIGLPGDTLFYDVETARFDIRIAHEDSFKEEKSLSNHRYMVKTSDVIPADHGAFYFQSPGRAWRVPPNHVFVVGDNRLNSIDSRHFGFVHQDRLLGRIDGK